MTHSIHEIGQGPAKSWTGYWGFAAVLALVCLWFGPQAAFSADKDKGQQISRVIAKEMTAAQKALQAQQRPGGLNAFDKMKVADFKAFAYVKLNNLKAAQQAYEQAMATGAYPPEDAAKTTR